MTDQELMHAAIEEAKKSSESLKCGVVIARDGAIIAATYNSQRADRNATAHAEIKAIAAAGQVLGHKDLTGCAAFCTCEPCTMCLAAFIFAKIDKFSFGVVLDEISDKHIKISVDDVIAGSPRKMKIEKNFMKEEVMRGCGYMPLAGI